MYMLIHLAEPECKRKKIRSGLPQHSICIFYVDVDGEADKNKDCTTMSNKRAKSRSVVLKNGGVVIHHRNSYSNHD